MKNAKTAAEKLFRFNIYSLNKDGSEGLYLGDAIAATYDEALSEARARFLKVFRHGVKVVNANLH